MRCCCGTLELDDDGRFEKKRGREKSLEGSGREVGRGSNLIDQRPSRQRRRVAMAEYSERLLINIYNGWATIKSAAIFATLVYFADSRSRAVSDFYDSKSLCQSCYALAGENPKVVFEFGKCDSAYHISTDRSNLLVSSSNAKPFQAASTVQYYVVYAGTMAAFSVVSWVLISTLVARVELPSRVCVLIAFAINYLSGFLIAVLSATIFDLYKRDFGGGVSCYVQVLGPGMTAAVASMIWVWVIVFVFGECNRNSRFRRYVTLITQAVLFTLFVLFTVKAGIATRDGILPACFFIILAWQTVIEVPTLALAFRTLFDLSALLDRYGLRGGGGGGIPGAGDADDVEIGPEAEEGVSGDDQGGASTPLLDADARRGGGSRYESTTDSRGSAPA